MSAFDALERRALNLSLTGTQDRSENVVVVGLFTSSPPESHDGAYGKNGEPAGGGTYRRARATFNPSVHNGASGKREVTNSQPVVITGLPPGTYTHFGVFGSTSAGQA